MLIAVLSIIIVACHLDPTRSELALGLNALDIFFGPTSIDSHALSVMPNARESTVMTVVTTEFYEFDVVCSQAMEGLQPKYSSIVSFQPMTIDDFLFDHCVNNTIKFEIRGFQVGQNAQYTLGVCHYKLLNLFEGN